MRGGAAAAIHGAVCTAVRRETRVALTRLTTGGHERESSTTGFGGLQLFVEAATVGLNPPMPSE